MNSNSLCIKLLKTSSQLINYQTVRWRRPKKPFWLGIAKSKMFVIPQPRAILTSEEKAQTSILNATYRSEVNSLLNFIRSSDPRLEDTFNGVDSKGKLKYDSAFEKEILRSFENNDIWNAESAMRRSERLKKEREESEEAAIKIMEVEEEKRKKKMELTEEIVQKEKLLSASYITPENLDEAIENCLRNVENYDFAIDLKGNKYLGSESLTSEQKKETGSATV